jgi:hypothetical protein
MFAALRAGTRCRGSSAGLPRGEQSTDAVDLAAVLHDLVIRWLDDNPAPPTYDHDDRPDASDGAALTAMMGVGHVDPNDRKRGPAPLWHQFWHSHFATWTLATETLQALRHGMKTGQVPESRSSPEWSARPGHDGQMPLNYA